MNYESVDALLMLRPEQRAAVKLPPGVELNESFVRVNAMQPVQPSGYKLHISVDSAHIAKAWNAILPILQKYGIMADVISQKKADEFGDASHRHAGKMITLYDSKLVSDWRPILYEIEDVLHREHCLPGPPVKTYRSGAIVGDPEEKVTGSDYFFYRFQIDLKGIDWSQRDRTPFQEVDLKKREDIGPPKIAANVPDGLKKIVRKCGALFVGKWSWGENGRVFILRNMGYAELMNCLEDLKDLKIAYDVLHANDVPTLEEEARQAAQVSFLSAVRAPKMIAVAGEQDVALMASLFMEVEQEVPVHKVNVLPILPAGRQR